MQASHTTKEAIEAELKAIFTPHFRRMDEDEPNPLPPKIAEHFFHNPLFFKLTAEYLSEGIKPEVLARLRTAPLSEAGVGNFAIAIKGIHPFIIRLVPSIHVQSHSEEEQTCLESLILSPLKRVKITHTQDTQSGVPAKMGYAEDGFEIQWLPTVLTMNSPNLDPTFRDRSRAMLLAAMASEGYTLRDPHDGNLAVICDEAGTPIVTSYQGVECYYSTILDGKFLKTASNEEIAEAIHNCQQLLGVNETPTVDFSRNLETALYGTLKKSLSLTASQPVIDLCDEENGRTYRIEQYHQ